MISVQLTQIFFIIIVVKFEVRFSTALDPFECNIASSVRFCLPSGILCVDLREGLLCGEVGVFPARIHLFLFFVQLRNVLYSALEYGSLIFIAIRHQLGYLVDTFVDGFATTTFN